MAIVSSTWFGVVESRDIHSAANQFAADMRLAHGTDTNRLGMAWIIFDNGNLVTNDQATSNGAQAACCVVQPTASGTPQVQPRCLPGRASISSSEISAKAVDVALPTGVAGGTNLSGLEFGADGSAGASGAIIGTPTIRVDTDNDPGHDVTFNTATSRVRVV
jgi:hypothetical protein